MRKKLAWIFTVALLMMVSMGAKADIDVKIESFTGGKITAEQKADGTVVTVTLTVTPDKDKGYKITKDDIYVYATISPSVTRADNDPYLGSRLKLEEDDPSDLSAERKYTVTVGNDFGIWVKEANFTNKDDGSKGNRDVTDYSGTYYIGSVGYAEANTTTNYYLCPTEGWCYYQATDDFTGTDNGMPFLTTYQCRNGVYDATKAVWYVEKEKAPNSSYYYIRQASTGRYLTSNGTIRTTNNADRMRVHLEAVAPENLDDKQLFTIAEYTDKNSNTYLTISPKGVVGGAAGRNWLTVNGGNKNALTGQSGKTGGPTGYGNTAGIICIYTQEDINAPFYLEPAAVAKPTITNNFDGTFTITAETDATIYYTTDGTTPTTETTTTSTTSVNVNQTESMTVIKAIAKRTSDGFPSVVTTYTIPQCARPVITISGGNVTITCTTEGATIYYTTNNTPATTSSTKYSAQFPKGDATTIRAIATRKGYIISNEAILQPSTEVSSSNEITDMNGNYVLASNFNSTSTIGTSDNPFKGTIDGGLNTLMLSYPLVAYAEDATIKNVILKDVNLSSGTNVGAICNEAKGETRIYNCGVLSGSVGGSDKVGGIVGLLDGSSRVINCYNFANITSGSDCGGIVGYNNVASTSSNLQTMVMNCMFYGNITGGNAAPIYGGAIIHNKYASEDDTGLNNYCYFLYDEDKSPYVKTIADDKYHGTLGAEERYLNRFEFFRMTLNSTRNLAAFYVLGDATKKEEMAKWVLDKSIAPYPILKAQDKYPSVVNPDAEHATTQTERNKGGLLGTLSVTISGPGSGAVFSAPAGAFIYTTDSMTLKVTDKDFDNFNYNYKKVQLPYYNDVGTGNYTGGRVVTGWKITSITGGTPGSFKTDTYDYPSFNFVDRKCTNKDLYSVSGRVFAQGAYWEVPDGVTAITIEPYWAKAVYLSDAAYDVTYTVTLNSGGSTATTNKYNVTACGSCPTSYNEQTVYTTLSDAITNLGSNASHTVYDYAVVLVGNYHQADQNTLVDNSSKPVTFMSADLDGDNEPDNTLFYYHNQRKRVSPMRFDFLNIPGIGMVKRTHNAETAPEPGIFKPQGWFEITNTVLIHCGQFEYAGGTSGLDKTILAPLILQGGIYEQFVSGMQADAKNTNYILIGDNAWFKNFANGCHTKEAKKTPKVPINVAGGDYTNFYLTGIYQPTANEDAANAECYIDGGRFTELAGAGMQQVKGNVTWFINAADITSFYGGGINAAQPITGNISTTISNSYVDEFYGGPKFGDMSENKTVTTNATDCHFGKFFGAGYGGTAFNRVNPGIDDSNVNNTRGWSGYVDSYYKRAYSTDNGGISTNYDYEFIPHSNGYQTVARFFVNYASLSLASTRNVTSTLSGCTIGTFYGGGSLGAVYGDVTSTLTDCTVTGNAFGAGFSAAVPTVEVWNTGAYLTPSPTYNRKANVFNNASVKTPKDNNQYVVYTWSNTHGSDSSPFVDTDDGKHYIHTDQSLDNLGSVSGNVILTINGTTTVGKSVFGGGEESDVLGNTNVTMTDGYVFNGIFGGGYSGSVGTVTARELVNYDGTAHTSHEGCVGGRPTAFKDNTGKCTVVVTGGQIGPIEVATQGMNRPIDEGGPVPEGWVWGGGCGIVADPATDPDTDFRTYVKETDVTIGGDAFILESIIGGGEFGRVLGDTHVTIQDSCQIGVGYQQVEGGKPKRYAGKQFIDPSTTTITNSNALAECSHYVYGKVVGDQTVYDTYDPYYDKYYGNSSNVPEDFAHGSTSAPSDGKTWIGCVFGGGSGYMPYEKKDESGYGWIRSAGWVGGNTLVEIKGGHILTNVYGANEYTDVEGKSTVKMSGGTVGVPRTLEQIKANPLNGNIFGAGKGDPRTYFNTSTNVGSTEVEITGGIVYGSVYGGGEDGHVIDNAVTTIKKETGEGKKAPVIGCDGTAGNNGNVFGGGQGATIALTAGVVGGNITLNILDGHIKGSVYGGGELASVGTYFAMANDPNYGLMQEGDNHGCIAVNLKGGSIYQNVYGGCMGTNENDALGISKNVTVNLNEGVADNAQGCVVKGNIFGCNNVNSSPEGTVTVHVYGTQHEGKSQIANTNGETPVTDAKTKGSYDVTAVYGGGNMAAYVPKNLTTGTTDVIIDGCGRTSIQYVYGGGNAASTPATKVTVNGTYEIEELFGGGNGKDSIVVNNVKKANPGANVGFKDYSAVESTYDTKEKRQQEAFVNTYVYGTGQASVNIFGGTIHRVFGGSNTKGNVRQTAVTMLEEDGGCEFCVDEAYGGGKSAPMDAEAKLLMSCIPGLQAAYGGAEAADILGNVTLNITNGTFDRVFGGNNLSGTISGSITVNIEEVGCKPVMIGELYGGGNQAAYSVYGYDNGTIKESGTRLYNDPVVNVKSFTSIGSVFGGGYGEGATLVGNPTVNINEVYGKYYNDDASVVGENAKTSGNYPIPSHAKGKMGAINNVFGGGNAARVIGNTTVNIGTRDKIDYVTTESGESTPRTNITVVGADIRSNVYGGGNNAEVTGNTEVVIGKKKTD